jgi:hypothetical protein
MAHKRKGKKKTVKKTETHGPIISEDLSGDFERPVIGAKNPWLYPKDGIGKLETGVVSITDAKQDENPKRIVHVLDLE